MKMYLKKMDYDKYGNQIKTGANGKLVRDFIMTVLRFSNS
jgi:hypothetical protein